MDDELHQLEGELKRLRPAPAPRALTARVQVELAAPIVMPSASRLYWWWAAALPAAAAITLALVYFSSARISRPSNSGNATSTAGLVATAEVTSEAPLKPVAAEKILISASDEGIVTLDDGTQARRERLRFVDTITWRNPRTNASLVWTVPREEVRVVPVVFQ